MLIEGGHSEADEPLLDSGQVGYSREYIERLVEVEQTRAEDAQGIQYEYNTEVRPHATLMVAKFRSPMRHMPAHMREA